MRLFDYCFYLSVQRTRNQAEHEDQHHLTTSWVLFYSAAQVRNKWITDSTNPKTSLWKLPVHVCPHTLLLVLTLAEHSTLPRADRKHSHTVAERREGRKMSTFTTILKLSLSFKKYFICVSTLPACTTCMPKKVSDPLKLELIWVNVSAGS